MVWLGATTLHNYSASPCAKSVTYPRKLPVIFDMPFCQCWADAEPLLLLLVCWLSRGEIGAHSATALAVIIRWQFQLNSCCSWQDGNLFYSLFHILGTSKCMHIRKVIIKSFYIQFSFSLWNHETKLWFKQGAQPPPFHNTRHEPIALRVCFLQLFSSVIVVYRVASRCMVYMLSSYCIYCHVDILCARVSLVFVPDVVSIHDIFSATKFKSFFPRNKKR